MFTGIVEEMGTVEHVDRVSLHVNAAKVLPGMSPGDSIAVNGACLTVTAVSPQSFNVELMPETLARSAIGALTRGSRVNLERALALNGRIGGHLVQGHVDATGKIVSMGREGNAVLLRVSAPDAVLRYVVEKGFIAVDGVSLTIVGRDSDTFTVSVVAYTQANTTLGLGRPGQQVNLEADIVGKYVEHFTKNKGSGLTMGFLSEHGFCLSQGAPASY